MNKELSFLWNAITMLRRLAAKERKRAEWQENRGLLEDADKSRDDARALVQASNLVVSEYRHKGGRGRNHA